LSVTSDLKKDHLFVRRLEAVIQTCSERLYANGDIPVKNIEVVSVIMEKFKTNVPGTFAAGEGVMNKKSGDKCWRGITCCSANI
jgi:hypothetical protein